MSSDADSKPAPKSPALLIVVAFGLFFVIFGSCAAYFLWPRGDRLGSIDLRAKPATLSIDVGTGDTLNFRMDTVTVGTPDSVYPNSSRSRSNKVQEELGMSIITLEAVSNDGASRASTECRGYAGKLTTGSSDDDSVTSSGLPLDCSLDVPKAGVYTLTAKTAWVPKDVREAVLEVRREKAGK